MQSLLAMLVVSTHGLAYTPVFNGALSVHATSSTLAYRALVGNHHILNLHETLKPEMIASALTEMLQQQSDSVATRAIKQDFTPSPQPQRCGACATCACSKQRHSRTGSVHMTVGAEDEFGDVSAWEYKQIVESAPYLERIQRLEEQSMRQLLELLDDATDDERDGEHNSR